MTVGTGAGVPGLVAEQPTGRRLRGSRRATAVIAGLLVALAVPATAAPHHASLRLSFGAAVMAYNGDYGEPSVAAGHGSQLYVTTPGGGGAVYAASFDHGRTWTPKRVITPGGTTGIVGSQTSGEDSDVVVARNGDVLTADLAIDGVEVSRSFDQGRSFPQQTFVPTGSADREWLATDGATGQDVYLVYHELATGTLLICTSTDGGKTFLPPRPMYSNPQTAAESGHNGTSIGEISTDGRGHVYVLFGTTRLDTTDTTYGSPPISTIHIAVSNDYGLLWNDYLVQPGAADANYGNFWMASAVDRAGNVYAVYSGYQHKGQRQHVWLQASHDHGVTWGPAMRVDPPQGNSLFGWVAGGGNDVAVVAWYHTGYSSKDSANADWVAQVAQVRGLAAGHPHELLATASGIIHHGGICTLGIFCGVLPGSSPDRTMLDFFKVAVDAQGMAVLSVADNADGRGQVDVIRQRGGPSAWQA